MFSNAKVSKPKPHTDPFIAQDPIPQEGKKKVFIAYDFGKGPKEVTWDVTDFNVDNSDDILLVRNIVHPTVIAALYGPGTWKYVAYLLERFENGKEKEEEENS